MEDELTLEEMDEMPETLPQVIAEEDDGQPSPLPPQDQEVLGDSDPADSEFELSEDELNAMPETLPEEEGADEFSIESTDFGIGEDFISHEDASYLSKAVEKAGGYFMKALEAESVVYKASTAADFAFQQGFSPTEVAQIAWDAMTDLERLHQPEMQDYIFMAAIQAGTAPQEAAALSNSMESTGRQMVGETMLGVSNFIPGMKGVRKVAVPAKDAIKWVAKLPKSIAADLPKKLMNSAFSLPEGMFERVSKRHILIDKAAEFFKPFKPNETVFDVYAEKLAKLYRDLEQDHIENLIETRNTLTEGLPAEDIFFALREATNDNVRMVGNKSEISSEFNGLISKIIDTVKSDISGSTNVQRIQGLDIKNKIKFDKEHVLDPHKVRDIMADIDDSITFAREKMTAEPQKVKMLWNVRKRLQDLLSELDGNVEYASRMKDLEIDRLRLDNFSNGFGISKSKRKAVEGVEGKEGVAAEEFIDDAFKKINGAKIAGYANEISAPNRSGRMSDYSIGIALKNMEKILESRPELRKDFFTTNDVLRDLATSEALKKATIQGSRKVAFFSVAAAAAGSALGIPQSAYLLAGSAAGMVADTNGREIGAAFIRNFVSETSKAQRLVIRPLLKGHDQAQKIFGDFLDTFAPALATAMTRRYLDDDYSAFNEETGEFKVYDWNLIKKTMEDMVMNDKIPTLKRSHLIVDWTHEFRRTSPNSVTMTIGDYNKEEKKNPKVENLKKFNKTALPPRSGFTFDTEARGIRRTQSPPSSTTGPDEEARGIEIK